MKRIAVACWLAAWLSCPLPAFALPFPWPAPGQYHHIILNADQSLFGYLRNHPDYFNTQFLVAAPYISNVPYGPIDDGIAQFNNLVNTLRYRNIFSGTYISGTTVLPEASISKYPVNAVAIEDLPVKTHYLGHWIREPAQLVVDLKDPFSRNYLEQNIIAIWRHSHAPIHFVDNAAVHPGVAAMQPWNAYCQHMGRLREYAERMDSNLIFNVFARPWQLTDPEMRQLVEAVAGNGSNAISFPIPWSKTIKDDKKLNALAIQRYRQLLNNGIVIILIPSEDPKTDGTEEELIQWVATWQRVNDRVYFAFPYWEYPPS